MKYLIIVFLICLFTIDSVAQRSSPGSEVELAAITERGRNLYAYDQAAWHSTDAVVALKPPVGSFESYLAQEKDKKWEVVYGKLNSEKDTYLIVYEAKQGNFLRQGILPFRCLSY
jgi:hypothetical protein